MMIFVSGEDIARDLAERGLATDDESFVDILAKSILELASARQLVEGIETEEQFHQAVASLSERIDDSISAYDRDRRAEVAPEVQRYLQMRSGG